MCIYTRVCEIRVYSSLVCGYLFISVCVRTYTHVYDICVQFYSYGRNICASILVGAKYLRTSTRERNLYAVIPAPVKFATRVYGFSLTTALYVSLFALDTRLTQDTRLFPVSFLLTCLILYISVYRLLGYLFIHCFFHCLTFIGMFSFSILILCFVCGGGGGGP